MTTTRSDLVSVPCRLCGAAPGQAELRYASTQDAGPPIGRITTRLVQCTDCGFVQVSPRPTPVSLAAYYDRGASASGGVFRETGVGSRHGSLAARRVRFVFEAIGDAREGRMVEVGCGRGDLLARMTPAGWSAVGIEPSTSAAEVARRRGCEVRTHTLGDASRDKTMQGAFDLVLAFSVLEHLDDPASAAADLASLVAPGGSLVVEVPDTRHPIPQVAEFFTFEHLSHFTPHTLARLFAARGFVPARSEEHPGDAGMIVELRRLPVERAPALPADDRDAAAAAIASYAAGREAMQRDVAARLLVEVERWRAGEERVAVYGAGVHTRFLFDLVPLRELCVCLLDGDEAKQGGEAHGLPIHAPEEARSLELDAVVLSSRAFEPEMAARLVGFEADGGQVVRLYT